MKEYISKTVRLNQSAITAFQPLSDMRFIAENALRANTKEIENIQSSIDHFSFTIKGIELGIQVVAREEYSTLKYEPFGASPFEYKVWVQLKEISPNDTRMRVVLHVKLNMMMKLMLKGKIQNGLDQFAEQFATSINQR